MHDEIFAVKMLDSFFCHF